MSHPLLQQHNKSLYADYDETSRPSNSSSDAERATRDFLPDSPAKFDQSLDQRDDHNPSVRSSLNYVQRPSQNFLHRRSASSPRKGSFPLALEQQRSTTMAPGQGSLDVLPADGQSGKLRAFYLRNKGVAMVLLAQVFGVLMNVTTRVLEIQGNHGKGMHPFQILFVRMIITTTLSTTYMWYTKIPYFPFGMSEVRWLLALRGVGGFFGVFGMYYSLLYLPLADATVVTFLAPSISCFACAILIKEPYTRMEQLGALISFLGVTLIARPTTLFSHNMPITHPDHPANKGQLHPPAHRKPQPGKAHPPRAEPAPHHTNPAPIHNNPALDKTDPAKRVIAVLVALIGVLGSAMAFTTMRWIGKRAHPLLSVNYFCVMCTIVSGLAMLIIPGIPFLLPQDGKEWTMLIFLGLCGFAMQFLLSAGLQHDKSSRATNMVYTQMLFALFFDKLVFGTNPSLLSLLGSAMILGSALYVALQKEAQKNREEEEKRAAEELRASGRVVEMSQQRPSAALLRDEERGLMDPTAIDDDDEPLTPVDGHLPNVNGKIPAKDGSVIE